MTKGFSHGQFWVIIILNPTFNPKDLRSRGEFPTFNLDLWLAAVMKKAFVVLTPHCGAKGLQFENVMARCLATGPYLEQHVPYIKRFVQKPCILCK